MIGLLFFLSLFVLSASPIIIRFAEADALVIVFWRMLMASLLLLPIVAFRDRAFRQIRLLSRPDWFRVVVTGVFLFLHFYLFFRAVQVTSIANSMILFSLNPLFTAVGAWVLFRERVTLRLILACSLGLAGVAVLFAGGLNLQVSNWQGDLLAALSGLTFSAYVLASKSVRRRMDNMPFALLLYVQTTVYAALLVWLKGLPWTGYDRGTWLAFFALAVLPTLLGHAVFTWCLQFLNVNLMSCATLVEPVIAALIATYLFSEPLTLPAVTGFALAVASVLTLYWPALRLAMKRGLQQ